VGQRIAAGPSLTQGRIDVTPLDRLANRAPSAAGRISGPQANTACSRIQLGPTAPGIASKQIEQGGRTSCCCRLGEDGRQLAAVELRGNPLTGNGRNDRQGLFRSGDFHGRVDEATAPPMQRVFTVSRLATKAPLLGLIQLGQISVASQQLAGLRNSPVSP